MAAMSDERIVVVRSKGRLAVLQNGEWSHPLLPGSAPGKSFDRFLTAMAHNGAGRWVVVGANGAIFYSDDLESWTHGRMVAVAPAHHGALPPRSLLGIAYGAGRFVAAGHDGTILYSEDGADWQVATQGLGDSLAGIAYGMNRFIIAGKSGTILVSGNGDRWVRQSLSAPHALTSVSASDGGFLIGGWDGLLFRSVDAENWEEIDLETTLSVTAVGSGYAGLADGTILEIKAAPIFPPPADETFFFRLVEEGATVNLDFPATAGPLPVSYQWQKDGADVPGATSPALELPGIDGASAGAYRLLATTAGGTTASREILVALQTSYEDWLVERSPFPDSDLADPEVTDPAAAPFGDGVPNLIRYSFDLTEPGDRRGLPESSVQTVHGFGFSERYLTLTFPRLAGADDVDFRFETSNDLCTWSSLDDWQILSTRGEGRREWVTIRDNQPIAVENEGFSRHERQRFIRVRVRSE